MIDNERIDFAALYRAANANLSTSARERRAKAAAAELARRQRAAERKAEQLLRQARSRTEGTQLGFGDGQRKVRAVGPRLWSALWVRGPRCGSAPVVRAVGPRLWSALWVRGPRLWSAPVVRACGPRRMPQPLPANQQVRAQGPRPRSAPKVRAQGPRLWSALRTRNAEKNSTSKSSLKTHAKWHQPTNPNQRAMNKIQASRSSNSPFSSVFNPLFFLPPDLFKVEILAKERI
jgi:hypothetical protein